MNNPDKEKRKILLSAKPIERLFNDRKSFNNKEDLIRFVKKRGKDMKFGPYPSFIYICGYIVDAVEKEPRYTVCYFTNVTELLNIIESVAFIYNEPYETEIQYYINRFENSKECEARQKRIKELQSCSTVELVGRKTGYRRQYFWQDDLIKAVLDTREHIPNGIERKQIRKEKAKIQKTY